MIDLDALLARLKMVMDTHSDDGGQVLLADGVEDCYKAITRLRADLAIAKTDILLTQSRVERLRAHVAALTAEVAKANADRDEARRELCEMKASQERMRAADGASHDPRHLTAAGYAADRGWDCFEEEACDD